MIVSFLLNRLYSILETLSGIHKCKFNSIIIYKSANLVIIEVKRRAALRRNWVEWGMKLEREESKREKERERERESWSTK